MKVRNGFVSNSSSSSFVLIGRKIPQSEITKHKYVVFYGGSLGDGENIFVVDEGDKRKLSSLEMPDYYKFYEAFLLKGEVDTEITSAFAEDIAIFLQKGKAEIITGTKDQSSGINGLLSNLEWIEKQKVEEKFKTIRSHG